MTRKLTALEMAHSAKDFLTILATTTIKHLYPGPPRESWGYFFHVCFAIFKNGADIEPGIPINKYRAKIDHIYHPPPHGIKLKTKKIPHWCRDKAHQIIFKKLVADLGYYPGPTETKDSDFFWKNAGRLNAEFCMPGYDQPNDSETLIYVHGGAHCLLSINSHRPIVCSLAKQANIQAANLGFRLAPEHPFPCALEDLLAVFIYISSVDGLGVGEKRIVLAGDSSAGGLIASFLILLASLDELQSPAGALLISPWVDLTCSMPSYTNNGQTDFLPGPGTTQKYSILGQKLNDLKQYEIATHLLSLSCPEIADTIIRRGHYYAPVTLLKYPLVSPLYAKDLHNLPPILITVGECERLSDEGTLFARRIHQAHTKNNYNKPSQIHLQIFEDMPHTFQLFHFHPTAQQSVKWCAQFLLNCLFSTSKPIHNLSSEEKSSWVYKVDNNIQCSSICDDYFIDLDTHFSK